jgi:hypothetical protein
LGFIVTFRLSCLIHTKAKEGCNRKPRKSSRYGKEFDCDCNSH